MSENLLCKLCKHAQHKGKLCSHIDTYKKQLKECSTCNHNHHNKDNCTANINKGNRNTCSNCNKPCHKKNRTIKSIKTRYEEEKVIEDVPIYGKVKVKKPKNTGHYENKAIQDYGTYTDYETVYTTKSRPVYRWVHDYSKGYGSNVYSGSETYQETERRPVTKRRNITRYVQEWINTGTIYEEVEEDKIIRYEQVEKIKKIPYEDKTYCHNCDCDKCKHIPCDCKECKCDICTNKFRDHNVNCYCQGEKGFIEKLFCCIK